MLARVEMSMKRSVSNGPTAGAPTADAGPKSKATSQGNGQGNGAATAVAEVSQADLNAILAGLQTMRDGDFSVRLPGSWTGVAGKVADTFNEIVAANQQMAEELKRVRSEEH